MKYEKMKRNERSFTPEDLQKLRKALEKIDKAIQEVQGVRTYQYSQGLPGDFAERFIDNADRAFYELSSLRSMVVRVVYSS